MDKRERIIFNLPADQLEPVKILLERLISYYYVFDQDTLSENALERRYDSVMTELCRLNEAGVELGLLMRMESFASCYPSRDPSGRWPEFIAWLRKWGMDLKITRQGTGSGAAACAETD